MSIRVGFIGLRLAAGMLGFMGLGAPAQWVNVTANLAGLPSECGNLCLLSEVPGRDTVIAGVARRGLWQSTDGGANWAPLGTGTGSDVIVNRPSRILYDPADARIFWASGIYNGPGVHHTTNGGVTFQRLGDARHNDDVNVDFSDPLRRTMIVGGHEQSRTVLKSADGGRTWANIGSTLPAETKHSSNPLLVDVSTYLVNASGWGKGTPGVYRTADGGAMWSQVSALEANGSPLKARDGSIYWPLMSGRGVIRSADHGLTWTQVCGSGVVGGSPIIELPDGRLAAVDGKAVKVSADHGVNWAAVSEPTPIRPAGVIYSTARKAFFIWHWDCGDRVLTNAVWRHDHVASRK